MRISTSFKERFCSPVFSCLIAVFMASSTPMASLADEPKLNMEETQTSKSNKAGDLRVSGAWARMSFGRAINSAGFLMLRNTGKQDALLIGASAPISKKTELHTHIHEGDIMRMRRVEGGIAIPKGGSAELKPGGLHIMFIGLHKPLKNGDRFPLTLKFKDGEDLTLTITAQKGPMDKGMMDHSKMKMK